ncbi:MAG TPA: DUF4142 domain-containing protein [Bacteroidia bacterium]|nr:DUF4142 domain-containing protein [Bacteroidia bacterium]
MKTYMIGLLVLCAFASCDNNENKPEDSTEAAEESNDVKFNNDNIEKDADFAVKAADAGMFEVAAAELAIGRTANMDVKTFAASMQKDHAAINSELKALAREKNITLPDSMSVDTRDRYNDLAKKSGKDFDEAYVDLMVKDHKNAVDLFQEQADKGNEGEMKSWASAKLLTLQHHLSMAEETQDKLKK